MIFNFAQKRKSKKAAKASSFAPSPGGEGCGTQGVVSASGRGKATDRASAPAAFGPVYEALSDMEVGGCGILGEFDMPEQVAEQLMNLGLVPGLEVMVAQSGPGGDPRVYRVDGVEVALRGELAKLIAVRPAAQTAVERALSLCDKGAAPTVSSQDTKRPTLRSAKDGAPRDRFASSGTPSRRPGAAQEDSVARLAVGLSTQEASAD